MRTTAILAFIFSAQLVRAAILTVSNDVNLPAQFTSILDAHDAANDGDTVFVYGTATNYSALTIVKPIYLLGNGYDPYQPALRSRINGTLYFGTGSDGCLVEGMELVIVSITSGRTTIRNCRLSKVALGNNGRVTAIGNTFIRTGVFTGSGDGYLISMNGSNAGTNEFKNNIFASSTTSGFGNSTTMFFGMIVNSIFQNNVFLAWGFAPRRLQYPYSDPDVGSNTFFFNNILYSILDVTTSCIPCSFNNNLVQGCTDPGCLLVDMVNGQTGGNNIQAPISDTTFMDYTDGVVFDPLSHDLRLLAGTLGAGAGVDGTDLGVFGGTEPMLPGSYHDLRLRRLPYLPSFLITTSVLPTGCPIEYSVSGDIIQFPDLADRIMTGAEVYFDQDPGPGNGIPVDLDPAPSIELQRCLDTLLSVGPHQMCFRFETDSGLWSAPRCGAVLILDMTCNQAPCEPAWDCPAFQANVGDPCEDGDPDTEAYLNLSCDCTTVNTSLDDHESNEDAVLVIPNPNSGQFILAWHRSTILSEVVVLDALGRQVPILRSSIPGQDRSEVRIMDGSVGLYQMRLAFEDGSVRVVRVVVN